MWCDLDDSLFLLVYFLRVGRILCIQLGKNSPLTLHSLRGDITSFAFAFFWIFIEINVAFVVGLAQVHQIVVTQLIFPFKMILKM